MQVVNPCYAHESSVGPVFDVGTWIPRKWYSLGWLVSLILGIACVFAACVLLFPDLLEYIRIDSLRRTIASLQLTIEKGQRAYPWPMLGGAALAAGLAYIFLSVCVADQLLRSQGPVYLRVGPGGMSLRVPVGLDAFRPWYKFLELDAASCDIVKSRVVQHKQLGAISPNAGNLNAYLHLSLRGGARHTIDLSWFREPARIIWNKIQDSVEMVPMSFTPQSGIAGDHGAQIPAHQGVFQDRKTHITGVDDQRREIEDALRRVLTSGNAFVVFSDPATEKLIQFCDIGGALWLDLPAQSLTHDEQQRAADYFQGLESATSDGNRRIGQSSVGVRTGFELSLGTDVSSAAQVVLDVFQQVYRTRPGFEIEIDEQGSFSS